MNGYEQAKGHELFSWKYFIGSFEAEDQVGFQMQHISDGVVYADSINILKWV